MCIKNMNVLNTLSTLKRYEDEMILNENQLHFLIFSLAYLFLVLKGLFPKIVFHHALTTQPWFFTWYF